MSRKDRKLRRIQYDESNKACYVYYAKILRPKEIEPRPLLDYIFPNCGDALNFYRNHIEKDWQLIPGKGYIGTLKQNGPLSKNGGEIYIVNTLLLDEEK